MTSWYNNKKTYTKKGRKNKTKYPNFIRLCKMNKNNLKSHLRKKLEGYYDEVIDEDGFLYAKGKDKILLTAHMDTVHDKKISTFYELEKDGQTILSSPQGIGGDDRCGIYMILMIIATTNLRPSILFCEDEEIGLIGSSKFTNTNYIDDLKNMYFLIELDRKNANDVVYYSDVNTEFHDYVEEVTGYKEAFGSCSDISNLSPACGISSVNISCGYYNQHTKDEYVVMEEMFNSIDVTIKLINMGLELKHKFEYKERKYRQLSYFDNYYKNYYGFNNYDYYEDELEKTYYLIVSWNNGLGDEGEDSYIGDSIGDTWVQFHEEHPNISQSHVIDFEEWYDNEEINQENEENIIENNENDNDEDENDNLDYLKNFCNLN